MADGGGGARDDSARAGADRADPEPDRCPRLPDLGIPANQALNPTSEDAPISFRRFLDAGGGGSGGGGVSGGPGGACLRPDVAAGLPDFVQDHIQLPTAAAAAASSHPPPACLPAGASESPHRLVYQQQQSQRAGRAGLVASRRSLSGGRGVATSRASVSQAGAGSVQRQCATAAACDDNSVLDNAARIAAVDLSLAAAAPPTLPHVENSRASPLGLPDFLSDGPMNSRLAVCAGGGSVDVMPAAAAAGVSQAAAGVDSAASHTQRLAELERENSVLREMLNDVQQQLQRQLLRATNLEEQLQQRRSVNSSSTAAPVASSSSSSSSSSHGDHVTPAPADQQSPGRQGPVAADTARRLAVAADAADQLIARLSSGVGDLRAAISVLSELHDNPPSSS